MHPVSDQDPYFTPSTAEMWQTPGPRTLSRLGNASALLCVWKQQEHIDEAQEPREWMLCSCEGL